MDAFLERAKASYGGDAYLWDKTEQLQGGVLVSIVCPEHGPFQITRDNFIYHRGCLDCRAAGRLRGLPKRRRNAPPRRGRGRPRGMYTVWVLEAPGDLLHTHITVAPHAVARPYPHYVLRRDFVGRRRAQSVLQAIRASFPSAGSDPDFVYSEYREALIGLVRAFPTGE